MLLLTSAAHAFCGTYVGAVGTALDNASTVVVLAQDGGRTTLTLVPDVAGDATEFGVVIPVPAGISAEAITDVDADAVELLDRYSVPRGVAYTCDDLYGASASGGSGCAFPLEGGGGTPITEVRQEVDDEVAVHSSFTRGAYDLSLVSGDSGDELGAWLDGQGYAVPEDGAAILEEYRAAGTWFLTARVSLDGPPTERTGLRPLRIEYDGESWMLPLRIGTISAAGPQEVVILALADQEVGISNYPELAVETECMWRGAALDDTYEAQLDTAVAAAGGAGWLREYSWPLATKCDPCTTEQTIDSAVLSSLGYDGASAHLTRLRMRYDPTTITQDLTLYPTGRTGVTDQVRFVRYDAALEEWFPVCDEGWAEDPGTCPVEGGGCDTPTVPVSIAGTALALGLLRRRR